MKFLFILNDPPYGTERSYNGLRLAMTLTTFPDSEICIFLLGDAVACSVRNQKTPDGYYNLERMIRGLVTKRALVKCCGTCLGARGLNESSLVDGVQQGSMTDLAEWTSAADRIITL